MSPLTNRCLSLLIGLASSAAACGGIGQDRVLTVGVRPKTQVAADSSSSARDAGSLPAPGSDVTANMVPDSSNVAPTRGVVPVGAPDSFAGSFAAAGSRATRGGAAAVPKAGNVSAAGAGNGAAGAVGARSTSEDECGAIPEQPAGNTTPGRVGGAGLIEFDVNAPNVFVGLRTTLSVPVEPPPNGPIYIWPGLQPMPNSTNFQPLGNGALMSVLGWGAMCASDIPQSYSTWWAAPLYSNISTSDPDYAGCHSGKVLSAQPKQLLDVEVHIEGTIWTQKLVNRDTMEASEFSVDLKGQEQGRAFFDIELQTSNKPTEDVIFTNTVLSMDMSDPSACEPVMRGMNDFASKPRVSADGKHCCIDRIVLRASRVMATTMDPL